MCEQFSGVTGYDVYLVGGCVRDLILKRIPKDFDVITSAELKEVCFSSSFSLSLSVGSFTGYPAPPYPGIQREG